MMDRVLNELERRLFLLELAIIDEESCPIKEKTKIYIMNKRRDLLIKHIHKKQVELGIEPMVPEENLLDDRRRA